MMVVADTLLRFLNELIERRCIQSLSYGRKRTYTVCLCRRCNEQKHNKNEHHSTVLEIAKTLAKRNVSSVLLEDSGKIIDILTERDLVRKYTLEIYSLVRLPRQR